MLLGIIQKQKMYASYLQQLYHCRSHTHHAAPMWASQHGSLSAAWAPSELTEPWVGFKQCCWVVLRVKSKSGRIPMPCPLHHTSLVTWRILNSTCVPEAAEVSLAICAPAHSLQCQIHGNVDVHNPSALQAQFIWNDTRHSTMESISQSSQGKWAWEQLTPTSTCSSCPSVVFHLLFNCLIAPFVVSVLFCLLHGMQVPCTHHLLSLSRNVWNSSHLFQYSELNSNIFFCSNTCTFSSSIASCDVHLVQPNELPDMSFPKCEFELPAAVSQISHQSTPCKYRFNWFHFSGNHEPTPLLLVTFNYEQRSPEDSEIWKKLKKNMPLICQIRAEISKAALSWEKRHFLQKAMEYISLGYVKMCKFRENKSSKTFETDSKGRDNLRFWQRPEKDSQLESS